MTNANAGSEDQFKSGVVAYQNGLYREAAGIWARMAQKTGDPAAEYNLGLLYEQGLGVDKSFAVAARYYLAAARRNYAPAEYNLAGLYYRGQGAVQSNRDAVFWWSEAAQQGYAKAQFVLGVVLLQGKIVPKNEKEGMQWLEFAARKGDRKSKDLLARIRGSESDKRDIPPPDTRSSNSPALPSDLGWIFRRKPSSFTVQLATTDTVQDAERFIIDNGIRDEATYYKEGDKYIVIGGAYEKKKYALTAIAGLTPALQRLHPIVRTFASVQKQIRRETNHEN